MDALSHAEKRKTKEAQSTEYLTQSLALQKELAPVDECL